MKQRKPSKVENDLHETGIFVFLTLIIFFGAVGFPTLINTSPSFGYEGIEFTPVTTAWQEAYAEQQVMETLAFYNYNPLLYSAWLVMPNMLDNPSDFTTLLANSYTNNKWNIETGIIEFETIKELFTPKINELLNFKILPSAYADTVFSDDFSVDPASNGWTESAIAEQCDAFPVTATGTITSNGSVAILEKTGLVGAINLTISKTFDLTGFSGNAVNITGFQSSDFYDVTCGTSAPDPALYIGIEVDTGSGFVEIYRDTGFYDGAPPDATGADNGNEVNTPTGNIALGSSADNNPSVVIKIIHVTSAVNQDFFLDNFEINNNTINTFNQTITDTATVSDQVTVTKFAVDTTGLEIYWKFDETSGGFKNSNITNIFPDGNSTTETGTFLKSETGIIGTAWKSPATGNTIKVLTEGTPSDYDFMADGNSTFNMWIKDESCSVGGFALQWTTFDNSIADGANTQTESCGTNDIMRARYFDSSGSDSVNEVSPNGYYESDANTFDMYTIVHDNTNDLILWFKNGVLLATNTTSTDDLSGVVTDNTPILWNSADFNVGYNNGTFDEFSFWSRALSTTDVTSLYNNGNGLELDNQTLAIISNQTITDVVVVVDQVTVTKIFLDTTDLEAYWKFDETSGGFKNNPIANIFPDGNSTTETGTFSKSETGIINTAWKSPATGNTVKVLTQGTPSDYNFFGTGNSTINMWVKDESCSTLASLWGTIDIAIADGVRMFADDCETIGQATVQIQYFDSSGSDSHLGVAPAGYYDNRENEFHMYTVVHDNKPSGSILWYKDSILIDTDTTNSDDLSGIATDQTPYFWNGDVLRPLNNATFDEWSFWSKALSSSEITTLFNNGFGLELENQVVVIPIINNTDTATVSDEVNATKITVPAPDPVTGLTAIFNETSQSIDLSWDTSSGADSYRIYRTSTETGDEVIEYFETSGGSPQNIAMTGSSGNFDAISQRGDHFNGWAVDRWEGLVISRTQFGSGGNRCSESSAVGGFTTGSLFNDSMISISSDNSTIANSTNIILPENWGTNQAQNYFYRGSDLLNITNGVNIDNQRKLGIGISWWDGTSGSLFCDARDNVGEGANSFWNFITQLWISNVSSHDLLATIAVINNTKLSADPEVSDTGTNATTFSDTNIDEAPIDLGNTYFYRIVGLNANPNQGGFSSTINVTAVNATIVPPPDQVTGVFGNYTLDNTEIRLTWTEPSSTNPILNYSIFRQGTGAFTFITNTTNTNFTNSIDTLFPRIDTTIQNFNYTISAISQDGAGENSTIFLVKFRPDKPTSLVPVRFSESQIDLSWVAPTGTIVGYKIDRAVNFTNLESFENYTNFQDINKEFDSKGWISFQQANNIDTVADVKNITRVDDFFATDGTQGLNIFDDNNRLGAGTAQGGGTGAGFYEIDPENTAFSMEMKGIHAFGSGETSGTRFGSIWVLIEYNLNNGTDLDHVLLLSTARDDITVSCPRDDPFPAYLFGYQECTTPAGGTNIRWTNGTEIAISETLADRFTSNGGQGTLALNQIDTVSRNVRTDFNSFFPSDDYDTDVESWDLIVGGTGTTSQTGNQKTNHWGFQAIIDEVSFTGGNPVPIWETLVNDTASASTTFSDTSAPNSTQSVIYRVSAYANPSGLGLGSEEKGFIISAGVETNQTEIDTVTVSDEVNTTFIPAPPLPPTNVSSAQNGTDITITWTKEATADGYKILRKATNDTTSKVKGEDLPNDYLKLNDKPVGDVEIGGNRNTGSVTFSDFICGGAQPCGRAQNFTMTNEDFTLDKIRLKIIGTGWTSGTSVLKVAVFNGSSASLNEILENSTDIFTSTIGSNPFPSGSYHDFEFDDFVLLANKTYMVGAYTNGSIGGSINMFRDDTAFGFTSYATNFDNGELVFENGGDLTAWSRFNTLNLQIDLIGDQFEEIATVGDVDEFTDVLSSEDEGNLFFYKIKSLTGSIEGNASSIVNQTAPLISGSDLFNSTSKIWQFREHDLELSHLEGASGAGCLSNCGSGGKFPNANVSIGAQEGRTTASNGESLPSDLLNINTGVSGTGGDSQNNDRGAGIIHFFKIFNTTEITDSSITIAWQQEANGGLSGDAGLTSVATLSVFDGIINKDSGFNFAHDIPVVSNVDGVRTDISGSGLSGIQGASVGAGIGDFNMTIQTLNASSINWGSFNSSFATVVVSMIDPDSAPVGSNSGSYELFIANITVSKIGTWNFTNPQIIYTVDGNRQLAVDVCPKRCMDSQKGFIGERGFVNTTSFALPSVPDQVTGLTVIQNMTNNAELDWDDASGADNYQVFRTDGSQWIIKEHTTFATNGFNGRYGYTVSPNGTLLSNNADETGIGGHIGLLSSATGNVLKTFAKSFIENKDIILEHQSYCGLASCLNHGRISIKVLDGDVESNIPTVFPTDLPEVSTVLGQILAPQVPTPSIGIQNVTLDETGINLTNANDTVTVVISHADSATGISSQHEIYRLFIGNASAGQTETIYDFSNPSINFTDLFEVGVFGDPSATLNNQNGTVVIGNGTTLIGSPILSEFTDSTISPITNLLNYTVHGNNTQGFGLNSTIVQFGLIQPIAGLTANATNSTTIKLSWNQASTVHPSDPLTGVIIQRANETGIEDTIWQYREVKWSAGSATVMAHTLATGNADQRTTITSKVGTGMIFKTFPFEFLNNSRIIVDWSGSSDSGFSGTTANLQVYNHAYTRSNFTEIPTPSTTPPNQALHTEKVTFARPYTGNPQTFARTFDSVDWINNATTDGFSTVIVNLRDASTSIRPNMQLFSVNITDITTNETKAFYPFGSNFGTTITAEVTATSDDYGFYNVTGATVDGLQFVTIATVDELDTMYNDTGLPEDTTFSYRAKGVSALSTGAFDEIVNATTTIPALPIFNQTEIDTATVSDQTDVTAVISQFVSDIVTAIDNLVATTGKSSSDTATTSDQQIITSPPFPITTLSASTVGNTCELSWSAPPNGNSPIIKYQIFRAVSSGAFSLLLNQTFVNHTDTGLINNVLYEYNVTSINAFGDSEPSNIENCMPIVSTVPNAPSLTDVNEEPNGDVTIDWIASTEGSPTGYKIERKVGGGGFLVLVANTGNSLVTFTDTTTSPATQFTYRISGINAFGTGAPSNEGSITTASPPNAPLLSGAQNGDQIDISWTVPASANPINGYKIDRRINLGAFTIFVANTSSTLTTFSDSNVTKPDIFGYRVRALSSAGEGTVSNIIDITFGSHVIVEVREQDGSGFKGGGIVTGQNSTFNLDVGLDVLSNAVFDNLAVGNFNFTFIDSDDFILNKTFNFPAPAGNDTSTLTINALVFDVDCPDNGLGTDLRIKVNYTDAKDITEFPSTPVCDSTDQVSWSTRWQGDAVNDTSTMIADFISPKFRANAETFLASAEIIPTVFNSSPNNQIVSDGYVVNMTDVTINFNLFMGRAPQTGGGGSGGSGSQPTPQITIPDPDVVFADRLTGLSILSRTHQFAQAGDVIEGSITVNWEGEDNLTVKGIDIINSELDIRFDLVPFPLDQIVEGTGEFAMSSAEIPYIIVLPPNECNVEIGITQNCFDPTLHTLPVEFLFGLGDQEYEASTEIFVDGRPIPIDIVQLQIILLFLVLVASAVFGNFIRNKFKKSKSRSKTTKKKFKKKFDAS